MSCAPPTATQFPRLRQDTLSRPTAVSPDVGSGTAADQCPWYSPTANASWNMSPWPITRHDPSGAQDTPAGWDDWSRLGRVSSRADPQVPRVSLTTNVRVLVTEL